MPDLRVTLDQLRLVAERAPGRWQRVEGRSGVMLWWKCLPGAVNDRALVGVSADDVAVTPAIVGEIVRALPADFAPGPARRVRGRDGWMIQLWRRQVCACGAILDSAAVLYGDGKSCSLCVARAKLAAGKAAFAG